MTNDQISIKCERWICDITVCIAFLCNTSASRLLLFLFSAYFFSHCLPFGFIYGFSGELDVFTSPYPTFSPMGVILPEYGSFLGVAE